jgi:hypothetical protein
MTEEYVRFSEESNALDYLEKTVEFIRRVDTNPTDWKWVTLSLHGALYGFMICALKGTDPDRVVLRTSMVKSASSVSARLSNGAKSRIG